MRILIISYSYTPAITPRAFRWSAIAEYWARQGDHVDVVSAWNPGLLQKEVINGVCVHRVGGAVTEALRSKLQTPGIPPNTIVDKPTAFDGLRVKQNLTSFVKWVHDQTWKKIYWPDYACLWYFPALKEVKRLLKLYNYNAIITVSHPFTGHLVGLKLKKDYPTIPWLVDIGDPFCFLEHRPPNNYQLYKKMNYNSECEIFRRADLIAVTTKTTLEKYSSLFPESAEKLCVILPLISIPENNTSLGSIFPKDEKEKVRLVFLGTLYKSIRSPKFLLQLFRELLQTHVSDTLELHFFGSIYDCAEFFEPYQKLLENKIFIHGIISHDKVYQVMKEADILINIGNNTPFELPSKLVEYAGMSKPILNILKDENDISVDFLDPYSGVFHVFQSLSLDKQLIKLISFIENPPKIEKAKLQQWLSSFKLETIAAQYKLGID
ncbi:hypothetical protein [Coleofasciculus sp. F4-SAH-05]|uniref:hypothetical protein n=1 Tax=Coleofasciculus sp. F4-SAH-05 TaxID=3069525 RepID=UPI0032F46530